MYILQLWAFCKEKIKKLEKKREREKEEKKSFMVDYLKWNNTSKAATALEIERKKESRTDN